MKAVKKWISHNQGTFVSILICAAVSIYIFGCPSKVESLYRDDKMVTKGQLEVELKGEMARIELALQELMDRAEEKLTDIGRQDAIKQKLMDAALISTAGGGLNPAGLVGLLIGVLGIGLITGSKTK